jgi:hypothetical protein
MIIRPVESTDHAEWLRMRLTLWGGTAEEHTHEIDTYFLPHSVASPSWQKELGKDSGGLSRSVSETMRKGA